MKEKKWARGCWLVLAIIPFFLLGKTDRVECRWQKTPLVIDGETNDWTAPFFHREKSVQVDLAFGNDSENLYVLFIFREQKYLSSIAQTGLTVWINAEGKNKKALGVRFDRKTVAAADLIAAMEKKSGPLAPEKKKELLAKPSQAINQYTVVDKSGADRGAPSPGQGREPEFNALLKPGRLVYEMKIPLGGEYGAALAAGKTANLGFEWGGLTAEMRREMMRPAAPGGGGDLRIPETPDLDRDSLNDLGDDELPIMRGPKHHLFWFPLTLAAGQ